MQMEISQLSQTKEIKEEGTKIKAMVDRHVEKMIATLREKAQHEKEPLTKTLVDYKQQLEKAKEIEKREHKTQLLHIGHFMAVVFTSDTLHADGNITVVTNKNEIFFVFITSQFYFL
jgi:hypothetical protein